MREKLLIVEDEETLCNSLKRVFASVGYEIDTSSSAESALQMLEVGFYDLIITDIILPGITGIEFIRKCRELKYESTFIVMTAYGALETAVEALRAGAYDYIIKPIIHDEIKSTVRNALTERTLRKENIRLKKQISRTYDFDSIIGESVALGAVLNEVKKVAPSRSNVFIFGETGTGKELVARAIHHTSERRDMPFIPINCSAIPENLLESELFGYVKGAFTGAISSKRGLFEEADGGTLLLDEIGELSLQLQSKLLRVIDDHEIRPLGGVNSRKVDIRFISATNRDIELLIREGKFRQDLYYRINVVSLKLPPLRERREDIIMLVKHFMSRYAEEINKDIRQIDDIALRLLVNYDWPGNVRELQNIIERAVLITDSNFITREHLPAMLKIAPSLASSLIGKALSIEDYTKEFILQYQSQYTENQLAQMLGITRKCLWEKRKKWGLPKRPETAAHLNES